MSIDQFDIKFIKAVFFSQDSYTIINDILKNKQSIPLDLIQLGFSHSFYEYANQRIRHFDPERMNPLWIHVMAYCEDLKTEETIEKIFLSEPRVKGDCLLALWFKNPQKVYTWLELYHKIDSNFQTLSFQKSPLVDELCMKFACNQVDLFNIMLLKKDDGKQNVLIEESFTKSLITEAEFI